MPSSDNYGKKDIKKYINNLIKKSSFRVLDLGCGRGTYAELIDKECYKVAVDAHDYTRRFNLLEKYNEFHKKDIRDTEYLKSLGKFDLTILGDVLEHLDTNDAQRVLSELQTMSDNIIVAVPYEYPQIDKHNHWEDHLQDDLTPQIMRERYPQLNLFGAYFDKKGKLCYGYYTWKKED